MPHQVYALTKGDKELLNALVFDLATELDLHYDDEDFPALSQSFALIKASIALLERVGCQSHADIEKIIARFNKTQQ